MLSIQQRKLTIEQTQRLLIEFDSMFSPHLSDNLDIFVYSEKLSLNASFILCDNNGETAGYIAYYENVKQKTLYITSICVKDTYRSRGVASQMLDYLITSSDPIYTTIQLEVRQDNKTAISFYDNKGFIIVETRKTKFLMNKYINMSERDIKYKRFVIEDEEQNAGRLVNGCDELRYLLQNPKANSFFSKHYENELLSYATHFSNFYKKYAGCHHLEDFPILNKSDLKEHFEEIAVPQYSLDEKICTKYTSGSTGTPFRMILDKYKHARWIAGNKIFREIVGVKSHEKTVFVSETIRDKKIPLERMEKDNVYYKFLPYLDDKSLRDFFEELKEREVRTMTALASIYDAIARWIINGNAPKWEGHFISLFSVSEPLKETTRKIISDYFNCPLYVFYANEENGVLGVEDGSEYGLRANNVDFKLEVLKMDSDEPAADGEIGRLVITDYFNKAFPIIRYENGDLVSVNHLADGRLYIKEIIGRLADTLYATDGRIVPYFDGISFIEEFQDIRQFQLIQDGYTQFTWLLNTDNHSYEEIILERSKRLFGEDSSWTIKYVNDIPKLRSGKFRMTVCNIKK